MPISDFYIASEANKGKKIKLKKPDGTVSKDWIVILSQWSDNFQSQKEKVMSEAVTFGQLTDEEKNQKIKQARIDVMVPLIGGWSFKKELTDENVRDFLENAPQIREQINTIAGDDAFFFSKD